MLLGFKRQFAPYVEEGSKTHTIRAKRTIPPRVGETCHCYVDPRQKSMRLLGRFRCTKVDDIRIRFVFRNDDHFPFRVRMWINGEELERDEVNALCWRDGFRTARDCDAWIGFFHCWDKMHGLKEFRGDLIHWKFEQEGREPGTRRWKR